MVIGREQALARAIDLVQAGISVDVVGSRGSGRSTFLTALQRRLEDSDWIVVPIRGVASLRQYAFAALHLAGIGGEARTGATLHSTAAALREATKRPKSVLFLDDWDDLDESSWGIAESIRRATGLPIVLSRLQGLRARHTPTGLPASTLEPSYVIRMTPLRFDDMERAIVSYLGNAVEGSTMSRIFAKSGGNIGLAVNLVDATTREGLLTLRQDRMEWTASRDLWSPGLTSVLEGYLENLDAPARDALEIIAIVGVAGIDSVRRLVDWATLEQLEERSLIMFVDGDPQQLVTVVPPLLVEFFRHEPLSARRVRLTELILDRLGTAQTSAAFRGERNDRDVPTPEREAVFVRLLHERLRTKRLVTASEWEANASAANAVRYVNALVHTYTTAISATVNHVFFHTDITDADPVDVAAFIALRARWMAYAEKDTAGAFALLHSAPHSHLGPYRKLLDAAEIEISVTVQGLPDGFEERIEVTDDLPQSVKRVLWETQLLIMVSYARFEDAGRIYARLTATDMPTPTHVARVLHALALVGQGHHAEALDNLLRGFDEAHGLLDFEGIRIFGAAAALSNIHSGDYSTMDDLLETVFAAGDPTPVPAGTQLGLYAVSALNAARRGLISTSERMAAEVDRIDAADGPLPGQSRAWAHVQLLVINGRSDEAALLLWESSILLWDRGARYAALVGALAATEISPTDERLTHAAELVAAAPEAIFARAQLRQLRAARDRNPAELLAAAHDLDRAGRIGLALGACQQAASLAVELDDASVRLAAEALEKEIRDAHPGSWYDVARFSASTAMLSEREKEVARLAATGHSNQEIATRLVLSVRTVESHMHRILRKVNVSNRHALRAYLDDLLA